MSIVELVHTRTLDELADAARSEYAALHTAAVSTLDHGFRLGEILCEAHAQLAAEESWRRWLKENLGHTIGWSYQFERFALLRDTLPPEVFEPFTDSRGYTHQPSLTRAFSYLRGLPPVREFVGTERRPAEMKDEARRLVAAGASQREAARILGTTQTSVAYWVNPEAARRAKARHKAAYRERVAARRALQREREAAAIKASGADIAEVYSLTRRSLRTLEQMLDKAEDSPRYRRKLNALITDLHRVEESVVAILKDADR